MRTQGGQRRFSAVPTIYSMTFEMVGTLPPSLVELRRTWALCPPYDPDWMDLLT